MSGTPNARRSIVLVGASRGIGLAMAAEFIRRDWLVVATLRGTAPTKLHELARLHPRHLEILPVDITQPLEIEALRGSLSGRRFDVLFVNAGVASADIDEPLAKASTEEFVRVMVTNVLGPMQVVEALQDLVIAQGIIGVMSSGQGSVGNNETGQRELYRASKAALNMSMRSYAARRRDDGRSLVLMAPGWIRTELGGPEAPFSLEESIPPIVDALLQQQGRPGLHYVDRRGEDLPW